MDEGIAVLDNKAFEEQTIEQLVEQGKMEEGEYDSIDVEDLIENIEDWLQYNSFPYILCRHAAMYHQEVAVRDYDSGDELADAVIEKIQSGIESIRDESKIIPVKYEVIIFSFFNGEEKSGDAFSRVRRGIDSTSIDVPPMAFDEFQKQCIEERV